MAATIGLSLPNRGVLFGATTIQEMYALAERAEQSGYFGAVWVGDGLIAKPRIEAVALLSALAARTKRVRLGTCCMATFPLRSPVLLACQWASLDVLSNGRSLLAVCLGAPTGRGGGDFTAELEAMDVQAKERVGRMEEGIEVLRALWSGPADHKGRYVSFPEIDLQPKPTQSPCPIWLASNPDPAKLAPDRYQAALARVARLGDGWLTTVVSPADFGHRWFEIRESAERQGRNPDGISSAVHLMINLQQDTETARAHAKSFLDEYYATDVQPETMDIWGAYGSPADVAARIHEYQDVGLDQPILRFVSRDQKGQLEWAIEELLPLLVAPQETSTGNG